MLVCSCNRKDGKQKIIIRNFPNCNASLFISVSSMIWWVYLKYPFPFPGQRKTLTQFLWLIIQKQFHTFRCPVESLCFSFVLLQHFLEEWANTEKSVKAQMHYGIDSWCDNDLPILFLITPCTLFAIICLSLENVICHFITHSLHRSSQSAFVFTVLNHPVSSVNFVSFLLIPWSFIIKVTPYYIYCGSLLLTFSLSDYWPYFPSLFFLFSKTVI